MTKILFFIWLKSFNMECQSQCFPSTGTSSYSISDKLLDVLTDLTYYFLSVLTSTLAHLSTSTLMCSLTTFAWAFLIMIYAPSLIMSSWLSFATRTAHPCSSPTITSADLLTVPSYLNLSLVTVTDLTSKCIVTLVPGFTSFIVMKVGFCKTIGSFLSYCSIILILSI